MLSILDESVRGGQHEREILSAAMRQTGKDHKICLSGVFRNEYKRASMSAIADAAGISKSLLFYYFKNKKELYLYLVCHAENLTRSAVQDYGVWETEDSF